MQQIEVTAVWHELDPNSLYMTQHIGELDVGGGRKWQVTGSLTGLDLIATTDLPTGADRGSKNRRFILHGFDSIKALANDLLRADPAPEGDE